MRTDKVLSRMYSVAPQDTDRFYLRMLLLHTPNAECFVGPTGLKPDEATTWRGAATALGLVEDDSEYEFVMHEAALTHMPGLMRALFVQILVHCEPAEPRALWEHHKEELAADFLRVALSTERGFQAALRDIDHRLHSVGKSISDFNLPDYPDYDAEEFKNRALRQALAFDAGTEADLAAERVPKLSEEQRAVFDAVMSAVSAPTGNPRGNAFYVDGPGGSGKTFLYEALIHTVRSRGNIAVACAMSGIAAQLLPGGATAHSLFGLPLDMPKFDATSSIRAQEPRAEVLRRAVLILWDEASMVPLAALDAVERLLRDLTGDSRAFGGKVLILGGDFRQLLPVMPGANEPEQVANTILQHFSMRQNLMARFSLTTNMRLRHGSGGEDTSHRDWLLKLGSGLLSWKSDLHRHAVSLPEHLCMPAGASVEDFIHWIFPDVRERVRLSLTTAEAAQHDAWFSTRAILTSRNNVALQLNTLILDQLDPAGEQLALSLDSVADSESGDSTNFPVEFLNSLSPSGLPPHKLRLRVGAVIIVLRNLDKDRGICNGCRCLVLKISRRLLDVRILTGRSKGDRYLLPRIPFRSGSSEFPFILRRRQFPVRLAWAMSIHKAQGQTLVRCGVLLPEPVFAHGQLYVCASRASSAGGLRFWLGEPSEGHGYHDDKETGQALPYTHNIIFSAVLQSIPTDDRQEGEADMLSLPAVGLPEADQRAETTEYVDLSAADETVLNETLNHTYPAVPVESGAYDDVANAKAGAISQKNFFHRAQLMKIPPSVWAEVSQRPVTSIEEFLRVEERPDDPGASSSGSFKASPMTAGATQRLPKWRLLHL